MKTYFLSSYWLARRDATKGMATVMIDRQPGWDVPARGVAGGAGRGIAAAPEMVEVPLPVLPSVSGGSMALPDAEGGNDGVLGRKLVSI